MTLKILAALLLLGRTALGAGTETLDLGSVNEGEDAYLSLNFTAPRHCETNTTVFCETANNCPTITGATQNCVAGDPLTPSSVTYQIHNQTATGTVLLAPVTDAAPGAPAKVYVIPDTANRIIDTARFKNKCEPHVLTVAYSTATVDQKREYTFCVRDMQY